MDNFTKQPLAGQSLDSATRDKLAMPLPSSSATQAEGLPVSSGGSFFDRNRWFILLSALALVVIGLLAYFAMRKPSAPLEPKVKLQLIVPAEVASSSEAILKTVIENADSQTITNGELELTYPSGSVFVSSNPAAENLSGTLYRVPDLSPGTNLTVFTKLKFEGGVGSERSVQARFKYKLSGLSAEFVQAARAVIRLIAAGVSLDIEGPKTATAGQLVSYKLHYANQSSQAFERVRIRARYPQGFQFGQSTPEPSGGNDTWDAGQLLAGASGDITISGAFPAVASGQSVPFTAEVLVPDKTGGWYVQAEAQFATSIGQQPLVVAQTLQSNPVGEALVAGPGDVLQYRIEYKNNTALAARGVSVVFSIDSTTVDLSSIQAEGASVSGNTVSWTASSYPPLEVVTPGQAGSLNMSVRVKDPVVKDRTINPELSTSVQIKSDEFDTFLPGNKLLVKLSTKFSMEGAVIFASGQRPPKVGQESRYTVTLSLKNSTSEVSEGLLTLFVGSGNNGFDKSSVTPGESDRVTYDASTGKLIWRVDTVRAHTGDFAPPRVLQFTLRFVPASSNAGKPVILAKNIQFSGRDNNTLKAVNASLPQLTTSEGSSSGDGIVLP